MTKQFTFAAVMSVITRRALTKKGGLDETFDLIEFLTGRKAFTHDTELLNRLFDAAQSQLFQQFPALGDGHTQFAQGELILMFDFVADKDKPNLILGWLSQQSVRLGKDLNEPWEVREPSTR